MPTYAVLMKQDDEGCDHTIGCGYKWEFFEAGSKQVAVNAAMDIILDGVQYAGPDELVHLSYFNDERRLKYAFLVEVQLELPIGVWVKAVEDRNLHIRLNNMQNKERTELERLKTKYEGK